MDATLLRANIASLRPIGTAVMRAFYTLLFERHPELKPLFAATHMAGLEQKIFETLDLAVQNLGQPDVLRERLAGLGRNHQGYGVQPAHYGYVLDCLMEALRRASGPAWTPQLESDWREAYGLVAGIMSRPD